MLRHQVFVAVNRRCRCDILAPGCQGRIAQCAATPCAPHCDAFVSRCTKASA